MELKIIKMVLPILIVIIIFWDSMTWLERLSTLFVAYITLIDFKYFLRVALGGSRE